MKMTTDPLKDIISNTRKQRSIGTLCCYNFTQHHRNFTVTYKEKQTYTSFLETKLVMYI
jgi:hypothetical protein